MSTQAVRVGVAGLCLTLVSALAVGCGDDDGPAGGPDAFVPPPDMGRPDEDSGPTDDAGPPDDTGPIEPPDAGPARDVGPLGDECFAPGVVQLEPCGSCGVRELFCLATGRFAVGECFGSLDEPLTGDASYDFDTRFAPPGRFPLPGCVDVFPPDAPLPPQVHVRYTVAGTGRREVVFTTALDGTDEGYDTQIQVRREDCETPPTSPSDVCFQVTEQADGSVDARASGVVAAEGGETLDLVVSAVPFAPDADRGRGRLEITTRDVTVPVARSATGIRGGDSVLVEVEATDEGGDAMRARVGLLDATGTMLDLDLDGRVTDADRVWVDPTFRVRPTPTSFRMRIYLPVPPSVAMRVASGSVQVLDTAGNESAALPVALPLGQLVFWNEACDATRWCPSHLTCSTSGRCEGWPELERLCAAATPLALSDTTPRASAVAHIEAGPGDLDGVCGADAGDESAFLVTVPPGRWDLVVDTRVAPTPADVRPIVYVLARCGDPWAGVEACEDGSLGALALVQDALPGTHAVLVELPWTPGADFPPTDVGLEVALIPVAPEGAPCPAPGEGRCASFACGPDGRCL